MNLDELIEKVGCIGKFQFAVIFLVMIPKLGISYNVMIMTFGNYVPDWWCVDDVSILSSRNSSTYKVCPEKINSTSCVRVYESYTKTVVTQWDLTCERKWIAPIITSVQMSGVLLGAVIAGQSADTFGRKKTYYITLLVHSLASILTAFVPHWQLFTFMRFCIGITIGSFLVVSMFPVEFLGFRWRPILTVVPFWATGVCLLALTSWQLHNWSYVHLVVGGFTAPFLLGWFFVPESVRWLTVKGRLDEAEKIIERIAKMNNKPKPEYTTHILTKISQEEQEKTKGGKKYTYIDLYRRKKLARHTITLNIIWWILSASYYGFAFGVGTFSGNFYLNLFLINILDVPFFIPTWFALNRLGRRYVARVMFASACLCCVTVIVIQNTVTADYRGTIITALSVMTLQLTAQAFTGIIVLTNESYPTVMRNLGYGASNTATHIGGIVAPFIFALSDNEMVPYIIVIVILAVSGLLTHFMLEETLGKALEDVLPDKIGESKMNNKNGVSLKGELNLAEDKFVNISKL